MPTWNFFAFDSKRVAQAILAPAHDAVRNRDLAAWQKIYDKLASYHYPPLPGGFAWGGSIVDAFANVPGAISRDAVPDQTSNALRKVLQTFVELVAKHHVESRCTRARTWVVRLVPWQNLLSSREELGEIERFKTEIVPAQKHPPDPFWCLASNDAVDANYIAPEVAANFAELEAKVGLLRSLPGRAKLDDEVLAVARDLAAAGLLIELAANLGLALYFREDGT